MTRRYNLRSVIWSLLLAASVVFLPSASAGVVGHLAVGNCGLGDVTVSQSTIDWAKGSPSACLQVGGSTTITSASGPITGDGTINDLPAVNTPPVGGIFGFMTFGVLHFDLAALDGFGPGSPISCSSNPVLNSSCSVPNSPFLLTNLGADTGVTLLAHGTILDTDGVRSAWKGAFTTQITGQLPAAIQTTILSGSSVRSTFSGAFDATIVPEPVSVVLIGAGLIVLGAAKRKFKRT